MQSTFLAVDIGASLQTGLDAFFGFVPRLIGFLVILLIGWLVAKAVKKAVETLLSRVGADTKTHEGAIGEYVDRVNPDFKPSGLVGSIAYWFILLGTISIAVSQLGIPALTTFVGAIAAYLPNVVAAVLIFIVAGAIAAAVGGLVARTMGDTPTGKIVGTVAPVLVMGIATFMILTQLQIAPAIVQITYIALLGSVSLGLALAFGLGGAKVASRMLEDAYDKGQQNRGQVQADMRQGREQAKQDAQTVQQKAKDKASNGQTQAPAGATAPSTGSGGVRR